MQAIIQLSNKPCVLCGSRETTVEAKGKGVELAGTFCISHLMEIMRRNSEGNEDDRQGTDRPGSR